MKVLQFFCGTFTFYNKYAAFSHGEFVRQADFASLGQDQPGFGPFYFPLPVCGLLFLMYNPALSFHYPYLSLSKPEIFHLPCKVGNWSAFSSIPRKVSLDTSCPPRLVRWAVVTWASIK